MWIHCNKSSLHPIGYITLRFEAENIEYIIMHRTSDWRVFVKPKISVSSVPYKAGGATYTYA